MKGRLTPLVAAALIVAPWSCTKLPSDPNTPFSIAFRRAPSPSVVLGDVMRDSTGQPAKLQAFAHEFLAHETAAPPKREAAGIKN